jgi:hypothetical protein
LPPNISSISPSPILELTGHEPDPARLMRRRRVERHDLDQGLAILGDDERLALDRPLDQRDKCVLAS